LPSVNPLAEKLLRWYQHNARRLPWRAGRDPYAVWVSEVMLQQTRVETVIPYFQRWMQRFPDVESLAAASLDEVLGCWEGLGYYGRARSLHRAARQVMTAHGGRLPARVESLRRLPGIGPYTAGAIASIAFGRDEAVLDGNLRRVFARLFDVSEALGTAQAERRLWSLAAEHLPPGRAGDYNQALMDLGATVCLPTAPHCHLCPLAELCRARALGLQEERPVRRARAETPHYTVTAAVIRREGKVLLARRPAEGLLGGLWEFPGGKQQDGEDLQACLRREIAEELGVRVVVGAPLGVYRHAYTHFRITLHAFECSLNGGRPRPLQASALAWVLPGDLGGYPMGKVDRMIARRLAGGGQDR
jgi:A/G-specific adenine glycosylase